MEFTYTDLYDVMKFADNKIRQNSYKYKYSTYNFDYSILKYCIKFEYDYCSKSLIIDFIYNQCKKYSLRYVRWNYTQCSLLFSSHETSLKYEHVCYIDNGIANCVELLDTVYQYNLLKDKKHKSARSVVSLK